MSKKLINAPDECIDQALEGLVLVHSGMGLAGGKRVVVDRVSGQCRLFLYHYYHG